MLEANPQGLSGIDVEIASDGVALATIDGSFWGTSGTISIDGQEYRIRRNGISGSTLSLGDEMLAEATHPILHRDWNIAFSGRTLNLKPASVIGRAFDVVESGETVGEVRPKGVFSRGLTADLPHDVPNPVQVFIVYVVLSAWRRRQAAAASS